ncbi:MAG: DUF1521 domain-containing protein [Planctomycetota bacterium]
MSSVQSCTPCHAAQTNPAGLSTSDNVIKTDRYDIHVNKGEVKIYDRETKTWAKAWGDPHLHTSDGDKAQFHKDNVTIDLQDGTKVTIVPTEPNDKGIALVDSVQVMKGDQFVEATGISTGPQVGQVQTGAAEADARVPDGTVLRAGHEVDDLFYTHTEGGEVRGDDPTQQFGEIMLDGQGGESASKVGAPATGGSEGPLGNFQPVMDAINGLQGEVDSLMEQLSQTKDPAKRMEIMLQIQEAQAQIRQLFEAMSNSMKSLNDAARTAAGNLR